MGWLGLVSEPLERSDMANNAMARSLLPVLHLAPRLI